MTAIAVRMTRSAAGTANHVLAAVGAALVALQLVTWARWLAAGPHQTTAYQDPGARSFAVARALEAGMGIAFALTVALLVRASIKQRRLTFEAQLFIAGLSALWLDEWTNFAAPVFLYNTQFTNAPPPTAFIPIPQPDPALRHLPFPILFHSFNYPVALVGGALLVSTILGRLRARFPSAPTAALLAACAVLGMVFDVLYDGTLFRLSMWSYPGSPDWLSVWSGHAFKLPIFEIVPAGFAFALFGALRFFRDDRGDHLTERGLGELAVGRRTGLSLLSMVAVVNVTWLAMCTIQVGGGYFSSRYPPLPRSILAGVCDGPTEGGGAVTGTVYGPCPGS